MHAHYEQRITGKSVELKGARIYETTSYRRFQLHTTSPAFRTDLDAIIRFDFAIGHGLWAAITAVERTPFVVVLVVAVAVSLVFGESAFFTCRARFLVVWVDALALRTE